MFSVAQLYGNGFKLVAFKRGVMNAYYAKDKGKINNGETNDK